MFWEFTYNEISVEKQALKKNKTTYKRKWNENIYGNTVVVQIPFI